MERYHGTYCQGKLEISGIAMFSGPQAVGGGGVPEDIASIFRNNDNINLIAIQYDTPNGIRSSIYQRMNEAKETNRND